MPAFLKGLAFYQPEERITNADLARLVATSDAWIRERTGIVERRRAPAGCLASDLAVAALRRTLVSARLRADDLDLLVCTTSTPDTLIPATACHVASKLGIDPPAFDLNAACAGFVYGLAMLGPMVTAEEYRRAGLVAVDHYTRFTNYRDRSTCILWADGAASTIVQPDEPEFGFEVLDCRLSTIPEGCRYLRVPVGGFMEQDGPKVMKYAVRGFVDSALEILERNGLKPADLAAFVGHQANYRILEQVVERLGLDGDRHWHTLRLFGNQGNASAPATLARWMRKRKLQHGDVVLVTVFGAGFSVGSALLRQVAPVRSRRRRSVAAPARASGGC